ncbi:DUF221-domain-containing protein [Bimuria novae-zelandiae CBS 107.79]|uniref:DUF221-domain-containing protein n=1 Tax=Bimuria novae-zelandiae CBS 107.79 TaxID=1447943 RepID=A0A6A5V100_9PLEO|nr:DUF221-domain-containing protein [Bimuria novae-zelandiae CBS 107.79]
MEAQKFVGWDEKPKPKGSAHNLAAIVSAFVPTWVTACLFIIIFVFIRNRYPKIYSPRTFIGTIPEKDRTPSASRSYFSWFHTLRVVPDKFVLYHEHLDSYLYLRFLRTLIFLCVVGCCITWPILFPINATGGGTSTQLDRISISNVSDKKRLYAHAVVAYVYFGFVMFTVARERLWLIGLRQAWNLSRPMARRLSSRTVLFLSAPTAALDQDNAQKFFGDDAVRVWPATRAEKLHSLVSSRDAIVEELEAAELKLIENVKRKLESNGRKGNSVFASYDDLPNHMKKSLRPTHTLKTPPTGKKVDSIDYYSEQLKEKEDEIQKARDSNATAASHGGAAAVFIGFKTQAAAQRAYQQIASAEILALNPRYTSILPGEIIWNNLTIAPAKRITQQGLATALVVGIIVFWSIPISLIGAWSNVQYLANTYKWLNWLNNLPETVRSLLAGLVPAALLSALASFVPNIFRAVFKAFGEPTNTSVELKVLRWYFVFQVLQVFLVNTIASGAAAVLSQAANNPSSIPTILATNLPSAANSYLTYFIVQGLTNASNNMLNYSDLLSYIFFDKFFDKTPRQKYKRFTQLKGIQWGKVFPKYGNFLIIAIAYSCIAPLVLGFAGVGLAFFYFSYRYMLLFTVSPKIDTKGHCYTLALQQILGGIYIAELCLLGLFGLRQAKGPSIMMGLLFLITILFNATTNKYFDPLEKFLPADLNTEEEGEDAPLLSDRDTEEGLIESHVHRIVERTPIPSTYLSPLARFFEPQRYASHRAMRAWLHEGSKWDEDDVPQYSEEQLRKAYLDPAFTSQTPLVWLPRDEAGVSKKAAQDLEGNEVEASDEGAWVDEKGKVRWNTDDFGKVPIFKEGVRW